MRIGGRIRPKLRRRHPVLHGLHLLDGELLLLLEMLLVLLEQELQLKLFLVLGRRRQELLESGLVVAARGVELDEVLLSLALALLNEERDGDVRARLVQVLLLLLLQLLLLQLLVLHGLLEAALLVQLLDRLVEALIGQLLVQRLIVLVLLANLPLQSLHIRLIAQ